MWENKILQGDGLVNPKDLNKLGEEGWELVTIIREDDTYYYYLKRPIMTA